MVTQFLRNRAYELLVDMIIAGEITPDEPLSERKLAETLSLSRTPIREALQALVRDGVIVSEIGRGTYVRRITADDIRSVYEVREALEGAAAALAAQHGPTEQMLAFGAQMEDMQSGDAGYSATDIDRLGQQFHREIFQAACNPMLLEAFEPLRLRFQIAFGLTRNHEPAALRDTLAEHLQILHAIEQRDSATARAAMLAHLERGRLVRMHIFERSGRPGEQKAPVARRIAPSVSNPLDV